MAMGYYPIHQRRHYTIHIPYSPSLKGSKIKHTKAAIIPPTNIVPLINIIISI